MPSFEHDGATIYYEEFGQGFPVLTFAPGGLTSSIEIWHRARTPVDATKVFSKDFRVIAMDQRNTGRSWVPITAVDGWHTYRSDHIALLDHLQIDRCHLYGQCIGGPFILSLLKAQPQRFASAVLAQPAGRVNPALPPPHPNFKAWVEGLNDHPEINEEVLDTFYTNIYSPSFVYSVDRESVADCQTPCLVLAGNDDAHPFVISEEIARLLPHSEFIPEWKEGDSLVVATARMQQFLTAHTPGP